ncbi:type II toxin-antitoxin system VapB family antitoxin [Leptospira sarikeiensis]|uniref:Type II toxin-antitoxin system VapB family antitoxin n=1 Tax=Leptospira sarikeiensis TaxID=2484943 RepID=A0A4R9KEJ3_9LEPT|nr:type II toxin-antitoxin system VapB family antitoxin [Leptospira sarikeiensis]TGL63633.1 type II toxin-antitoxin system VapB family antitoxin [Leptospira sarikeiensis]
MIAVKTTLYIPDELISSAQTYTGISEKTRLVQEGLRALIREKSAERMALLGGSDPKAEGPTRKKSTK